eukprot:7523177-Heterocapsa_arctica.AAC.1
MSPLTFRLNDLTSGSLTFSSKTLAYVLFWRSSNMMYPSCVAPVLLLKRSASLRLSLDAPSLLSDFRSVLSFTKTAKLAILSTVVRFS